MGRKEIGVKEENSIFLPFLLSSLGVERERLVLEITGKVKELLQFLLCLLLVV